MQYIIKEALWDYREKLRLKFQFTLFCSWSVVEWSIQTYNNNEKSRWSKDQVLTPCRVPSQQVAHLGPQTSPWHEEASVILGRDHWVKWLLEHWMNDLWRSIEEASFFHKAFNWWDMRVVNIFIFVMIQFTWDDNIRHLSHFSGRSFDWDALWVASGWKTA